MMHRAEIPVLQRQRQADLSEFEASLTYIASSRPVKTTQQSHASKKRDMSIVGGWGGSALNFQSFKK